MTGNHRDPEPPHVDIHFIGLLICNVPAFMLPLFLGSVISSATAGWASYLPIWPYLLWIVIVGVPTSVLTRSSTRAADAVVETRDIVTVIIIGVGMLVAESILSVGLMQAGDTMKAPWVLFWFWPIGLGLVTIGWKAYNVQEDRKALARWRSKVQAVDAHRRRCLELPGSGKIEFEDSLLSTLYQMTGDTRTVLPKQIQEHLRHDCFDVLLPHATEALESQGLVRRRGTKPGEKLELGLTPDGRDLCLEADRVGGIRTAREARRGQQAVKHEYNVYGQAGAVGPNAQAERNQFIQVAGAATTTDLAQLAEELAGVRRELRRKATTAEQDAALGAIAEAETAARQQDSSRATMFLARAGKWALDTAIEVGANVAAAAIRSAMKAQGVPMD